MTPVTEPVGSPEQNPRPVVALPRPGLPGGMIAAGAVLAAVILFLVLDTQRRQRSARVPDSAYAAGALTAPPPLVVPPEIPPARPRTVTVVTTPAPPPLVVRPSPSSPGPPQVQPSYTPPPQPVILPQLTERPPSRRNDPAIVYDEGSETANSPASADQNTRTARPPAGNAGVTGPGIGGDDAPARATLIGNRTTVMPTGTIIPVVLETPIDSARPGLVRAAVSVDAPGFDGKRVLVPRGSRLIGEYQSDVRSGQNRVLVTWTRLIRPDGVTIRLGSPAADPLGGAGVPGHVHTFFFQRFVSAVLQSALTVGVNLASRPGDGSVIVGLPGTAGTNIGQALLPPNDLRPKITVKQGAALNVFVARDLDFSGVPSRP